MCCATISNLNGPKYGCGLGECGACAVLIDGDAARSCVIPIEGCTGRDIVTLEGLGTREHPDPVQQAFIDEQAAQCGYCLNGMIMSTKALLTRNSASVRSRGAGSAALQSLPLRRAYRDRPRRDARRGPCRSRRGIDGRAELRGQRRDRCPSSVRRCGESGRFETFIRITADGSVTAYNGHVDLGTGIRTALGQIVAEELDVSFARVVVVLGDTSLVAQPGRDDRQRNDPDHGGAAAQGRSAGAAIFVARAAERLEVAGRGS